MTHSHEREEQSVSTRSRSGALDVTEGVIWQQLLQLAWPIVLSSFFQQAYMLVNAFVVGQFSTKDVLGGIQATSAICDLTISFCIGIGAGCAVIAGQFFGAREDEKLSRAVHTGVAIALILGITAAVGGQLVIRPVLTAMHTPAELLDEALVYGRWYFATMVFWLVENMCGGMLRAVGDSRTPSIVIGLACLINGILDLVFVAGLGLGAMGVGMATFLSVGFAAAAMSWRLMAVDGPWQLRPRDIRIDPELVGDMLRCGIPMGFQWSAYGVSNVIVQSAMNSFGADVVTAWGLQGRITGITWMVLESVGTALTTFSAQNFGARNIARMRRGIREAMAITFVSSIAMTLVLNTWIEGIASFFIDDPGIIDFTAHMTRVIAFFYLFYGMTENYSGMIRGAGESLRPMAITLTGTCVFRIVWLMLFLPLNNTLDMVLWSYPLSWTLTALIYVLYYRFGHWLTHAEEHEAALLGAAE